MIYYEQLGANISNSNSGPVYMVDYVYFKNLQILFKEIILKIILTES